MTDQASTVKSGPPEQTEEQRKDAWRKAKQAMEKDPKYDYKNRLRDPTVLKTFGLSRPAGRCGWQVKSGHYDAVQHYFKHKAICWNCCWMNDDDNPSASFRDKFREHSRWPEGSFRIDSSRILTREEARAGKTPLFALCLYCDGFFQKYHQYAPRWMNGEEMSVGFACHTFQEDGLKMAEKFELDEPSICSADQFKKMNQEKQGGESSG